MTVYAFLNQRGGQVLFGVTQAGTMVGQQVGERTIEELSAALRQIDPPAFPTVERVPVDARPRGHRGQYRPGRVEAVHLPRQRLPAGGEHDAGNVRRQVQPDAVRADAQRATLGEPASSRMVCGRP